MATLFRSAEMLKESLKLLAWEHDLGHIEADAELGVGDVSWAQLVEISEEFGHSSTLLLAECADASNHILNIVGSQLNDISCDLTRLSTRIVVKRLTVSTSNTEDDFMRINFVTEINVVDFISVSFIHVASQDQVENIFRSKNAKLS